MCYLKRSCFNKVLSQLQGCHGILYGIMTLLLFSLNLPPGTQVENLIISRGGRKRQLRESERETTYFSTVSARTLSLNLCPNSLLYSSEVSITCRWTSCRKDTNKTEVTTSAFIEKMFKESLSEMKYISAIYLN